MNIAQLPPLRQNTTRHFLSREVLDHWQPLVRVSRLPLGFSAPTLLACGARWLRQAAVPRALQDAHHPPWPLLTRCQWRQLAPFPAPVVTTKNVSRYCQLSPGRQNWPHLRTSGVNICKRKEFVILQEHFRVKVNTN